MSLLLGSLTSSNINNNQPRTIVIDGTSTDFANSVISSALNLATFSSVTEEAIDGLENIIILKNKSSDISDEFASTRDKFVNYASDSYGFVSRGDNAIVIVEDNHHRKNVELEGSLEEQAADTFAHELGHIIDNELSTTEEFRSAFLKDLKDIHTLLINPNAQIEGENLRESLFYLKHYVEGVNFEDGISEEDITRTGLRENFAECFSTIVDVNPTKINRIFSTLFTNTMEQTRAFIV